VRLYDYRDSGNGYKVRLLLAQLGRSYEYVEVDILAGESRSEEFLARNPNGRIPVLELDDGSFLGESNAILFHLAEGTRFLPEDALERARALQWLFFEQYSHEPFIATNRFWLHIAGTGAENAAQIQANHPKGLSALSVMNRHLEHQGFFTAPDRYGVADIALYAYTHVADQGGYDVGQFPALSSWLERVSAQPRYIAMDA